MMIVGTSSRGRHIDPVSAVHFTSKLILSLAGLLPSITGAGLDHNERSLPGYSAVYLAFS